MTTLKQLEEKCPDRPREGGAMSDTFKPLSEEQVAESLRELLIRREVCTPDPMVEDFIAALRTIQHEREQCPLCLHEWRRHDPEDGKRDAAGEGYTPCPCGRVLVWIQQRICMLSEEALK